MVVSRFIPSGLIALLIAGVVLCVPTAAWARKNGIAAASCDGCHTGGKPPTISITASPMNPMVGQAVTVTVSISQTNGPVAGFYLTSDYMNPGTFKMLDAGTLANAYGVTHTTPKTGSGGVTTFQSQWTSAVATGVSFSAYALSANGDGTPKGDAGGEAHLSIVMGCAGTTYYIDQDGDGYGSSDTNYRSRIECAQPQSYASRAGDCNDFNETIHPGAPELCDGKDNNCDGNIDENVVNVPYCEDKDGDGHGVIGGATKMDCKPSVGFGDCGGDCNDNNATVYPGAPEICDGRDNNCDGRVDEGVRMTCGVGWCRRYADGCTATCTPGAPIKEVCNYFDDDCDGVADNGTDEELCGGPGLLCILGKCVPGEGMGSGPVIQTGGVTGTMTMTSSGGHTAVGSGGFVGTGGFVGAGTGAISVPGGGGSSGSSAGSLNGAGPNGGCAVGPGQIRPAISLSLLAGATLFGLALLGRRGRRPLPGRRPPR
jgi:hypothetical protein